MRDRITTPGGRVKSGAFYCPGCRRGVGEIRNFKFDFLHFRPEVIAGRVERKADRALGFDVAEEVVPYNDPRIRLQGSWESWDDKYQLCHGAPTDCAEFRGEFTDIAVRLLKHPWSGFARFFVDGKEVGSVDLYQPSFSTVWWYSIATDLEPGEHTVRVCGSGKRNGASEGDQVLLQEFIVTRRANSGETLEPRLRDENRVLELWDEAREMMKDVPPDGLILDHGGGDRTFADPRYINAEYTHYQLPQVYGDALRLPFKENTFDFVMSQAVLEHVPNPYTAADEMKRVTKRGAKIWAGMAFMQPVHAVPYHYCNATAWGLEEMFKSVEIETLKWFGDLSFTVDWMLKTAGIAGKAPAEEYDAIIAKFKEWDKLVTYDKLRDVASGVAVIARKP